MTVTTSLSERLRVAEASNFLPDDGLLGEAADALDAKDAEIERLRDECDEWKQAAEFQAGLRREFTAEIELLQEGRKLHDEHADHLEHELAAQSALIAQAAAALERCQTVLVNIALETDGAIFNRWPIDHEPLRADARCLLPVISEALAAIRAKGVP